MINSQAMICMETPHLLALILCSISSFVEMDDWSEKIPYAMLDGAANSWILTGCLTYDTIEFLQ